MSFQRTDTDESRYVGHIDAERLRTILEAAILDEIGLSRHGSGITTKIMIEGAPQEPELRFVVVKDNNWFLKTENVPVA